MNVPPGLIKRMLLALVVGIILASIGSEIAYRIQGINTSRGPQTIELVIPAGTADKVAQGQIVLPVNQTYITGDVLLVKNQDSVTHTLGPLVIPANASASLTLSQSGNLNYICSFEPSKYYGMLIQPAMTITTRIEGWLIAGIPLGLLIGVYSLVAYPLKPAVKPAQN
jgi:hypothetical protein